MASKVKKTKRSRKPKTSKGINSGGGKLGRNFTEVEKVLLKKGMVHRPKKK